LPHGKTNQPSGKFHFAQAVSFGRVIGSSAAVLAQGGAPASAYFAAR
jgi:hypothetical protein